MKKGISWLLVLVICTIMSSCATIIGGAKYNAKVLVPQHPQAAISYNGVYKGAGEANFKVKRRDANKVIITVQDEGCEPKTQEFKGRVFRGWAFAGTVVEWSQLVLPSQSLKRC